MEFTGEAIHKLSMEERMTICNMSIEAGAKAGLISPDQTTVDYIRGRKYAPQEKIGRSDRLLVKSCFRRRCNVRYGSYYKS